MNFIVTGGAGFIGSNLVDALLERGQRVAVLDNFSTGKEENLEQALGQGATVIRADVREAAEVAWLLGAPFLVQVIEGAGEDLVHVVTGLVETSSESQRLLDLRWRVTVDQLADTVIASISGDGARLDFGDLAQALVCASRVVKPEGTIVLLSQVTPQLGPGAEVLRTADTHPLRRCRLPWG